jgi:ABC-type sugar transport system permease subunit
MMNVPSILLILGIVGYPLVYTVNVAFREAGVRGFISGQMPWVGLKNFVQGAHFAAAGAGLKRVAQRTGSSRALP